MAKPRANSPTETMRKRITYAVGYLTFGMVAIRELTGRAEGENLLTATALLGAILMLTVTSTFLLDRLPWYGYLYLVLQTGLIQALGLLPPYQDIWGALYIFMGIQAYYHLPSIAVLVWGGFASALMILTLIVIVDPVTGLGLGLTYAAGAVLIVSWDVLSGQAERANQESLALLEELQEAHLQLQDYAARVEEKAAIREHDRLAHELHDSVGQTLFGISLTTESARQLLITDPAQVPEQLERLQEMTSSALSQMRSLISQWRPG